MQHIFSLITSEKSIEEKDVDAYLKEPFQKKLREEIDKLMFQIVMHQTNVYKIPITYNPTKTSDIDNVYHNAYLYGHLVFGVQYTNEEFIDEYRNFEHYSDMIIGFINNSTHPVYIDMKTDKSKIQFPQMIIPPNSYKPLFNGRMLPYSCIPYEHLMWKSAEECNITIIYGILRYDTRTKLYSHIIMYEELLEPTDENPDIVIKSGYMHNGKYSKLRFDGTQREIVYL